MSNSRSKNAKLNIICGYFAHISTILLSFIGRKTFLIFLNTEYLGVNGLYSNILSVLSLAELGIDAAAVFTLYKPVAEENLDEIVAYVAFFHKMYRIIAVAMFVIGLCVIPFLDLIVKTDISNDEVVLYYVIFLLNSALTYIVADKIAFFSAKQEQRITKLVSLLTQLFQLILQILCLIITKNFFVYILVMIGSTIVYNNIIGYVCKKKYPYLRVKKIKYTFGKEPIIDRIKSTILYKFGGILINNTDNVLISCIVNTASVGMYSNYLMIINAIQGFVGIITTSLISGIGNVVAKSDIKRERELFNTILLFYQMIATIGALGLYFCANEFIVIWLGKQYCFSNKILIAIAFNFFISNIFSPIWMYREANGLFNQVKFLMLFNAGVNLLLSCLLGTMWGIFGILISTSLSRLLTLFWREPKILFGTVFNESTKGYWIQQSKAIVVAIVSFSICFLILNYIPSGICGFFIKVIIVISSVTLIYFITYSRSQQFLEILTFVGIKRN